MKKFLLIIFLISIAFSLTLKTTQKKIKQNKIYISKMNEKLDILAKEISIKQKNLNILNSQILNLNTQINELNQKLLNSNKILSKLTDLKKGYEIKANKIKKEIINFISENYFNTILKPENINDLINKIITEKILEKYSQKIASLLTQNQQINSQIEKINQQIKTINSEQNELIRKKQQLKQLLIEQKKEIKELNKEKIAYKQKLEQLLNEQIYLQKQLAKLKIIKKRKQIAKIPKNLASPSNVKKYGSIFYKPNIATYYGPKTIPPVYGKVIKKFGFYIDPIYKIKIYNDSITIKPYKPNSVVRAIFSGKVVYIGENNDKKIIIIKHKNNLFSIYANLSKISPILKKGFYVKKGQIIARVNNSLEFEITYKENPINPLKVIKLK